MEMVSRIRLLLIAPSLEITGGQSIQADRLRQGLPLEDGIEIEFLPTNPAVPRGLAWLQGPKYLRTIFNTIVYVRRLRRALRQGVGVVHVFTAAYLSFFIVAAPALLLSRFFRRPCVVHYHDGRGAKHLASSGLARSLIRLAAAIVVPSPYLQTAFQACGIPSRIIPNTLQIGSIPYRERAQLTPSFLHNRGMEEVYNVMCTIRAFALVQQRCPEASLTLAHDGPLRPQIEAEIRTLRLRNVHLTGAVAWHRMAEMYQKADIYLTSADYDNMPGSILEAFAAGTPVIATRAGGTEWIVRDGINGVLIPRGDYQGMAEAAIQLLEDPERARSLARAARRDCGPYAWSRIRPLWVQLYSELVPFWSQSGVCREAAG